MKTLNADINQIRNFKEFIHRSNAVYQIFSEKGKAEDHSEILKGSIKNNANKLNLAVKNGMAVTMMINEGNGRKSTDVNGVNALFIDFDDGNKTIKDLKNFPIEPHWINETSPGKFHTYWLIANCKVDQFKVVMQALAKKYGGDPNICDLSRAMRMPGTFNNKSDTPFKVNAVHVSQGAKPIMLEVFLNKMKLDVSSMSHQLIKVNSKSVKSLPDTEVTKINDSLKHVSPESYEIWRKVMMAIHSVAPSEYGYSLFSKWAKKSSKFKEEENRRNWKELKCDGGVNIQSLYWLANTAKRGSIEAIDEGSLAKLLIELYMDKLRYCLDTKCWYRFDNVVWVIDPQAPIVFAREMTLGLCAGKNGSELSKKLRSFLTVSGFKSIASHAELLPEIQIRAKDFDNNPDLLAVKNGVVNLTTGEFRVSEPSDYLRRQTNVKFDAEASCPEWIKFMKDVTQKDKELYLFIRRVIGYILIGRADLQVFFLILGTGSNGKGVLMRVLKSLLADYAYAVAPNLLTSAYGGNANSPTPALAALHGARLVICTELNGKKLDAGFIKQYAGGDEITARNSYGGIFTFKPEGKLFISANYEDLPEIAATDEAMWRRLVPIPFNAVFKKGKNDDSKLEERLAGEFSGILNWLIKGAVKYHKVGLGQNSIDNSVGTCAAVDAKKAELRMEADSILAWMTKCCDTNQKWIIAGSQAYESYTTFMSTTVRKPLSIQAFCAGLEKKNFLRKSTSKNNVYVGFRLR